MNSRPSIYKTDALPLNYRGNKLKLKGHHVDIGNKASQTRALSYRDNTFQVKIFHLVIETTCPSIYKTDILPLSYRDNKFNEYKNTVVDICPTKD